MKLISSFGGLAGCYGKHYEQAEGRCRMVKHILADGTEIKSIEGRIIPPTGETETVYRLIANFLISHKPSTAAERSQAIQV